MRGRLEEERVAALFGQGLFPTVSNAVIGAIVAVAMAPAVGRGHASIWLALMVVVTVARAGLWGLQRARPQTLAARGWLLAFTVGGTFNGLGWGLMAVLLWPPDAAHRALMGFVLGGMVASSTAVVPAYLPAFYTFVAATLLPPIARLLAQQGTVDITMGVLLTTFGLAMGKLARRAGRWFAQNTELRLHNAALVENLSEARDGLERRVQERTGELERTVELLRAAEARAQAALVDRDEFLAVASHELRTPIATLELHLSRLAWEGQQGHPAGAEALASLPLMHRQLRRLTGIVDTVLTASGTGRRQRSAPVSGETDLPAVVRAVVDDLVVHAGRVPSIRLDLEEPLQGAWDAARLEQIVGNLISNALHYGAGTPIEVRLAAGGSGDDVVLTVADGGPGVALADQPRVFERFFRAGAGAHAGGLGLGLAVVRELVEAMGGGVSLASVPGHGATFSVRLPRTPPAAPVTRPP